MREAFTNPLQIRWARFSTGERMPFLVARDDGLPLEAVTDWIVSQRRTYKQARTLEADLQNLQILYLWADAHAIDVSARVADGRFFTDEELRSLLRFSGWRLWRALEEVAESRFLAGRPAISARPFRVGAARGGPARTPRRTQASR